MKRANLLRVTDKFLSVFSNDKRQMGTFGVAKAINSQFSNTFDPLQFVEYLYKLLKGSFTQATKTYIEQEMYIDI